MRTRICDEFGIEVPIFAFSHCRDVVAAVSRAGGLGVLGALAFTPEQLEMELKWIDEHVDGKPYGVDVVMPVHYAGEEAGGLDQSTLEGMVPEEHRRFIENVLEQYEVPELPEGQSVIHSLLAFGRKDAVNQVDISLAHPIRLLVNALGPPPPEVVERAHDHGVKVAALVGRADQARKQVEAGVDIIVAQGTEAGGHTGEIATMVLVPEVVDAVRPVPVLAAGGIGSGRQAAAALALGADGVWTGSIWLTVSESDSQPVLVDKLLEAGSRDTVRSRCMTGKPARMLRTAWTEAWDSSDTPAPLPMPLQFMATADATERIHRYARLERSRARDLLGMPVGQIVGRMNAVRSSHQVIYEMIEEFVDAVNRLQESLEKAERGS
jgi:NAD(P)H-dependent flavin oxidoreductase YrpB (nitropropane dioxygenase family)